MWRALRGSARSNGVVGNVQGHGATVTSSRYESHRIETFPILGYGPRMDLTSGHQPGDTRLPERVGRRHGFSRPLDPHPYRRRSSRWRWCPSVSPLAPPPAPVPPRRRSSPSSAVPTARPPAFRFPESGLAGRPVEQRQYRDDHADRRGDRVDRGHRPELRRLAGGQHHRGRQRGRSADHHRHHELRRLPGQHGRGRRNPRGADPAHQRPLRPGYVRPQRLHRLGHHHQRRRPARRATSREPAIRAFPPGRSSPSTTATSTSPRTAPCWTRWISTASSASMPTT